MKRKLLLAIGCFFLTISLSACSIPSGVKDMFPGQNPPQYAGEMCIDPNQIGTTPILVNIPKPDETNSPFPNDPEPDGRWDCSGGGCDGPDFADYVMVRENVKIETIWPDNNSTRLTKQKFTDPQYDPIKDRVYRTSCNDWCKLSLPYGGTLHCEFIFLLHGDETLENRMVNPGVSEPYPKDGAMFDVLIRQGAVIPDYIGQPGMRKPLRCDKITPSPGAGSSNWLFDGIFRKSLAQNDTFISISDPAKPSETARFVYHEELGSTKVKIRDESLGRQNWGEAVFNNQTYDVYLNLITVESISEDYVYLVEKGILETVLAQPDPFYGFTYLEFRRTREVKPFGKTLQLGTFPIPTTEGWWTYFANESKPAIYIYPEKPVELRVRLNPAGKLTVTDPLYNPETGWEVSVLPNGTIRLLSPPNSQLPTDYSYLFYEAELTKVWVDPKGFIVAGKNLVSFFEDTLPGLGLNTQETKDFIEYWMTRLDEFQPYYFVNFLEEDQIEQLEPLDITYHATNAQYKPDTIIRIRAYFKPLETPVEVEQQKLQKGPERKGSVLVEWGGILDE